MTRRDGDFARAGGLGFFGAGTGREGVAGYLKLYALRAECVNKFSERRKFSCMRQRSSGVAARLRAKRIKSCSLRVGSSLRRRFIMAWTFFLGTLGG